MDHNIHNTAPMHWGYGAVATPTTTPQSHWAPPTHNHGVKRSMSESDCEELYSEESSKEQISPEPGSCQLMSRKKRRGVIEKKRRDRINSSLSELKRLVPSAYEKQGSAKLEKAEILQLTVEHLKNLHSKGIDSLSYDTQRFAMDYHIIGFRECAAEVARYLLTVESMDIQDLRLRLMSHLQYFVQQRELSAKGCTNPTGWVPSTTYQASCGVSPYQAYPSSSSSHASVAASSYVPNLAAPIHPYPTLSASPNTTGNIHQHQHQHQQQQHSSSIHNSASVASARAPNEPMSGTPHTNGPQTRSQTNHRQHTPTSHESHHQQQPVTQHFTQDHTHQDHQTTTYIELTSPPSHAVQREASSTITASGLTYGDPSVYTSGGPDSYNSNASLNYVSANGAKPYRPWGAEMAY